MTIQVVGVIGAGVMGTGVAQNLAQTGHRVILLDISDDALERARREIKQNLRFQRLFNKGEPGQPAGGALDLITFSTDDHLLSDVDFVIENVTEKWPIKQEVYARIDGICHERAIFASNTSAISITRIASATRRAPKVVGIHFMNPVPMKPMVEMIRGYHTSAETIAAAKGLLAAMGKECIVVNDSPGFVSNRLSHLLMNEAAFVVQDQVATPQDVDEIFKKCFGHPMGPLETADLIGLDTVVDSLDVLYESYQDPKFRCCPLLRKMVDAGLYGRKSGRGFYTYHLDLL